MRCYCFSCRRKNLKYHLQTETKHEETDKGEDDKKGTLLFLHFLSQSNLCILSHIKDKKDKKDKKKDKN